MAESEIDKREYSLVLVSHGLLSPLPDDEGDDPRRALELARWAASSGHGVIQLPPPGFRLVPGSDPAERRRLAREDSAALRFVFSQLRIYLDAGYALSGAILHAADVTGPAGRAWRRRLDAAADAERVGLPAPVQVPPLTVAELDTRFGQRAA